MTRMLGFFCSACAGRPANTAIPATMIAQAFSLERMSYLLVETTNQSPSRRVSMYVECFTGPTPLCRHRDRFDECVDHVIRRDPVGIRVVRQHHPVPQYTVRHGADVVGRHVIAALEPGIRPGGAIEADAAPRAGSHLNPFTELLAQFIRMSCGVDEVHDVSGDGVGHMDAGDLAPGGQNRVGGNPSVFLFLTVRTWLDPRGFFAPHQLQDAHFALRVGIIDQHLHQEPVELRLRQGIGAFLLDGILRRQHHEQIRHRMGRTSDGDLPFLHRFEQRGLHLRRRAVDLVGQNDVAENRPLLKLEQILAAFLIQDFGPGNVGRQKIRRELDAAHRGVQIPCQAFNGSCLRKTGKAFEQEMSVGQQADEDLADDAALADDRRLHFALKIGDGLAWRHVLRILWTAVRVAAQLKLKANVELECRKTWNSRIG
ncbi:protein of unknown function [Nitrospira japonica]|uniref:Uncharacterized protein n=1 Tax=Nitrospira japonica TaxID=1325564 RepID=A0A1W1I7S0_9BACT|nr:protein of unknown function [Nitrospira japonica]